MLSIVHESIRKRGIELSSIEQLWNSKEGRSLLKIKEDLAVPRTQLDVRKPIVVHDKNRTPISLPKGATALDFAYALGKDIGEHTAEVLINNRKAPLYRTITAGDIVEIRTSNEKQAQENWLHENYAITPEARQQIKEALSHNILERRGSSLLHQELERYHYALRPEVLNKELSLLVKQYNLGTPQEYLERLDIEAEQRYTPKWAALEIMHQITEQNEPTSLHIGKLSWVPRLDMQPALHGRQFSELRFCNFCQPTYPRDAKIMGRLRKQSGELVVHKESCPHLIDRSTNTHSTLLPMTWQLQPPAFRAAFFIRAQDRKGLIFDVAKQLRQHQSDIRFINADAESLNQGEALIHFRMEAHTDKEVLDIWQELYKIDNVTKVEIDASATPIHVYDRLQKQRKERESIPNNTTVKVTWKDLIQPLYNNPVASFCTILLISRDPLKQKCFWEVYRNRNNAKGTL